MIQPVQHQTLFARPRRSFEGTPDTSVRLSTQISLLVHVETVLGGHRGRVGHHKALYLVGNVRLPELSAEITIRDHDGQHNGNGHAEEHGATLAIVPRRFSMNVPLQHIPMPARKDSDVWALTHAPERDPPWMERYAGQLQGKPLTLDQHIPVDGTLDITLTPEEWRNGRWTTMEVAGELRFERSAHMQFLFRDPGQPAALPSEFDPEDAVLIVAGSRVPIPGQTVSILTSRNPRMAMRVVDANRRVVCAQQTLNGSAS